MNVSPTISIVFTNLNGGSEPLDLLASVDALDYPRAKVEVIMVDAGSTDGSDTQTTTRFPRTSILRVPSTLGLPGALNKGIATSRGTYVFVGNDDLVVAPSSLRILIERMEGDPTIGLASGRVYFKYPEPDKTSFFYAHFRFHLWTGRITAVSNLEEPTDVEWLQSSCILIRRNVFNRIGTFDEGFRPMYFDDLDFCLRASRAGFRLVYEPAAVFRHGASQTMRRNLRGKTRTWYRNKVRFLLKHGSVLQIVSTLTLMALTAPLLPFLARRSRLGLSEQTGGPLAVLAALGWNAVHLPETLRSRRAMTQLNP